jgi:hypothetical protein
MALAQIYGLLIPTDGLDEGQLEQLALLAPFIEANFNPDQPRDPHGRWTDEGSTASGPPRTHAVAAFFLAWLTFGLSWLFYPFFARTWHRLRPFFCLSGWTPD